MGRIGCVRCVRGGRDGCVRGGRDGCVRGG